MAEVCNRTFDIGDPLPEEYRDLLVRMMTHEGERTGNLSFMLFFASVLTMRANMPPTMTPSLPWPVMSPRR